MRGGTVTTTDEPGGGSLDTARDAPAEGDDIVVLPADAGDPVGLSRRNVVAAAGVVAILVIIAVLALAARHSGSSARVQTSSAITLPQIPVVAKGHPKPLVAKPKGPPVAVEPAPSTAAPTTAVAVAPPTAAAQTTPPTVATTIAAPKQYGPSVLTWDQPAALAIRAGYSKSLPVTAHNPSDGTVTLPHPLSCAPRLDHGEICPEMVQLIGPGQSASAQYTISAKGIAPGSYTLSIEGVLTVHVTVS
jgi:hypothetical protein